MSKPALRPKHDEITIERGLHALAVCNGNSRKAAKMLSDVQPKLKFTVIYEWGKKYPKRYAEIRAEVAPAIRAKVADETLALVELQIEASRKMTLRAIEKADELEARDLPGAVRNMSVAAAVGIDKAQLLNDQPTVRIAHNLPGVLKELKELGVEFIEGEAVEEAVAIEAQAQNPPTDH